MPAIRSFAELLIGPPGALVLDGANARLVVATEQFVDPTPIEPLPTRLDDYLDLVPPYNRLQPKFITTLSAALQPLCDLQSMLDIMPQQFDLDTAVGVQLDQVGLWIGRDRFVQVPILNVYFSWDIEGLGWEQGFWQGAFDPDQGISKLDDNTYRILLYAKAAANGWDGSFEEMVVILNTLLRGQNLTTLITDNEDMTVDVNISGVLTDLVFSAILQGGYLPIKPEGVKVNYTLPAPTGPQQVGGFSNLHGAGALSLPSTSQRWAATATLGASGGLAGDSTVPGGQLILASAAVASAGSLGLAARTLMLGKATPHGIVGGSALANNIPGSAQKFTATNADNVLSNAGLTVTKSNNDGTYSSSVGQLFKTIGRYYWEIVIVNMGPGTVGWQSDIAFGLANPSFDVNAGTATNTAFLGSDSNSVGWYSDIPADGSAYTTPVTVSMAPFAQGDRLSFALDVPNGKWWVRVNNGAWLVNAGGAQDPANNTGGITIPGALLTGGIAPAITLQVLNDQITGCFAPVSWAFVPPTGFAQM